MNSIIKFSTLLLCIVLLGLSSCENRQLAPSGPVFTSTEVPNPGSPNPYANVLKKYLLTKYSSVNFFYTQDKKLLKIAYEPGEYQDLEYGPNWVSITLYQTYIKRAKAVHFLNTKGLCYESTFYTYSGQTGLPTVIYKIEYEYNTANQLIKRNRKDKPNERQLFFYDAAGNAIRQDWYNESNFKTLEFKYEYELPRQIRQVDLYPLNARYVNGEESYFLTIFGKFNQHLLRRYSYKSFFTNAIVLDETFNYTLNEDGYVLDFTEFEALTGKIYQEKTKLEYALLP